MGILTGVFLIKSIQLALKLGQLLLTMKNKAMSKSSKTSEDKEVRVALLKSC
jgi:hypothetical protein